MFQDSGFEDMEMNDTTDRLISDVLRAAVISHFRVNLKQYCSLAGNTKNDLNLSFTEVYSFLLIVVNPHI